MAENEIEHVPEELAEQGAQLAARTQWTAEQVKANRSLIQSVMKSVMIKDVDYGKIPGCGDKPALLKPGAEKLMATFRLSAEPEVHDLSTEDAIRYRVKIIVVNFVTGAVVGYGIGEASSDEEKYKWRKAVSADEYEATPEDRRRLKYYSDGQAKQVRTEPADKANTVLKMAKKRGMVDGALSSTAASDIFTQDEDITDSGGGGGKPEPKKSGTVGAAKGSGQSNGNSGEKKISEGQVRFLHVKLGQSNVTEEQLLQELQWDCLEDIPMADMNNALNTIESLNNG